MIKENIEGATTTSMWGIFDGHGGKFAAEYGRDVLVPNLCKKIVEVTKIAKWNKEETSENLNIVEDSNSTCGEITKDKPTANEEAVLQPKRYESECYVQADNNVNYSKILSDEILYADYELFEREKEIRYVAGTTALIAVLEGSKLTVANVGDSRGVMCDSKGKAIPLSYDHKPDLPHERKRIEDAGGNIKFTDIWRVQGKLAMSRAMGDSHLKPKFVIADPDVLTFDLADFK